MTSILPSDILGPLTTIFTPPSDCFTSIPSYWSTCLPNGPHIPRCYWSITSTCWPPNGQTWIAAFDNGFGTSSSRFSEVPTVTYNYRYSPGVLPSSFDGVFTDMAGATTYIYGCLAGWNTYGYLLCTSDISTAVHSIYGQSEKTGRISAFMPQIGVSWVASDLPKFTPASAPILPGASITAFERSATRSIPTTISAQTGASSKLPAKTPESMKPSKAAANHGLSTGAEAGIGVGVAAVVIACIAVGFWWLLRSRRKRRNVVIGSWNDSTPPYFEHKPEHKVERKAELDNTQLRRELAGSHPVEIAAVRSPVETTADQPPIDAIGNRFRVFPYQPPVSREGWLGTDVS